LNTPAPWRRTAQALALFSFERTPAHQLAKDDPRFKGFLFSRIANTVP
jgi:hypothetical protein